MSAGISYPSYKPANISWLDKFPDTWTLSKLKFGLKSLGSGGTPDTGSSDNWAENDEDGYPWIAIADMTGSSLITSTEKRITQKGLNEKRLKLWPKGTLLFSMYASLGTVSELAIEACTNQAILSLVSGDDVCHPYLKYWLINMQPYLIEGASSNTQANLNAEKVKNLPLLKPGYIEQQKIAAFLDRETAKIDGLIQKQGKLIALLSEERKSKIKHALTKGLNSKAPLKNSEIPWIGSVPNHWQISPLKRLINIQNGADHKDVEAENGFPVYGSGGIFSYARNYLYDGESILLGRKGTIDKPLYVNGKFWTVDTMYWSKILPTAYGKFAYYLATIIPFEYYSTSTALPSMTKSDLGSHIVAYPNIEEQKQISVYLDEALLKTDALISKAKLSIELLKERRASLISAAVTGKIDVRELV